MKEITLTANESTIEAAKRLAERSGSSVSEMFERIVRFLDARRNSRDSLPPITRSLSGIIEMPPDVDYRDIVTDALLEKYGLTK